MEKYLSSCANIDFLQSPKSSPQILMFLSAPPDTNNALSYEISGNNKQSQTREAVGGTTKTIFLNNPIANTVLDEICVYEQCEFTPAYIYLL